MSGHNELQKNFRGDPMVDPGNAGTIGVDRSPAYVPLVSAGVETRTLARPTRVGALSTVAMQTDGGDITLTVTGGYNEDGDTTFVFSDPGQFVIFVSCFDGTNYFWRKLSDYTTGNLDPADLVILESFSGLTATVTELNAAIGDGDEIVAATNVIDGTENGKTFYLNAAGGFTSTLPAPVLGMRFRFIVKTAPTTAYIITTNAGANILYGMMEERAGTAGVAGAAQDTFNFVANQSKIADWVEFYSDGTNWYYHGMVDIAAGNTVSVT